MKGLHGKVALCTGSGLEGGLGHGILKRLGEAGCQLVVSDLDTIMTNGGTRSSDENPVVRELLDGGANAIGIACDISWSLRAAATAFRIASDSIMPGTFKTH